MIDIAINSLRTSVVSLGILSILYLLIGGSKFMKQFIYIIPIITFELIYFLSNKEPLLFEILGTTVGSYSGHEFAMSIASFLAVIMLYGFMFFKNRRNVKTS